MYRIKAVVKDAEVLEIPSSRMIRQNMRMHMLLALTWIRYRSDVDLGEVSAEEGGA